MDLDSHNPDTVEEIFARHGACSITLTDAGDMPVLEPAPGETPLWQFTRITGLFSADADFDELRSDLRDSLALATLPTHSVTELANRVWEREWIKDLGPLRFGERLWICPSETAVAHANAVTVRLDPGLAFGTGTHATTAMCLEWLDSLPLQGKTLLDFGCGSGVLAIAALKLGCDHATAMDIDPQAVAATTSNAAINGVERRIKAVQSAAEIEGEFDVVVANILAGPLIELAQSLAARIKIGCVLALSGILSEQVGAIQNAYRQWIEFDEPEMREHGGQTWARLTGRRIEG